MAKIEIFRLDRFTPMARMCLYSHQYRLGIPYVAYECKRNIASVEIELDPAYGKLELDSDVVWGVAKRLSEEIWAREGRRQRGVWGSSGKYHAKLFCHKKHGELLLRRLSRKVFCREASGKKTK